MIFIVECNNDYSFFKEFSNFLNLLPDISHCSDEIGIGGYDGVLEIYNKKTENNQNKLIIAVLDYDDEEHFNKLANKLKLYEDYNSCEYNLLIIFKKKENPKHQVWFVKPKAIESFVNEIYKEIYGNYYINQNELKKLKKRYIFEQVLSDIFNSKNFEKSQTLKNLREIISEIT